MGGLENGNFPLLYVVKIPCVGGWVVQKSLKTPLRNIKMAPYGSYEVLAMLEGKIREAPFFKGSIW